MNELHIVSQSNELIDATLYQSFNVQELRIILWLISHVHKNDYALKNNLNKTITVPVKEYINLLGINSGDTHRQLIAVAEQLVKKGVTLKLPGRDWCVVNWFQMIKYCSGTGTIAVEINHELLPFLINLKEKFTSYNLDYILMLQNIKSIKLYQLFASYRYLGHKLLTLTEFSNIFGPSYKLFGELNRRVVTPSLLEINTKTDLAVNYTLDKTWNKVKALIFSIGIKSPSKLADCLQRIEYVRSRYKKFKVACDRKTKEISTIVDADKQTKLKNDAMICYNRCHGVCNARSAEYRDKPYCICHYCPKILT